MIFAEPFVRKQDWGSENRSKVQQRVIERDPSSRPEKQGGMNYQAPSVTQLGVEMESAVVLP